MTHIKEKIAEFVFQELSTTEMAEANSHLSQCAACRELIEQFQSTHAMLKASPELDPPRRILFEFEKPYAGSWIWRWLAPMVASAAVALAVVSFAPRPQPEPRIVERIIQAPAAQPAAQPIDYQRILDELHELDRSWLENELKRRDAAQSMEIQRLYGAVASLDRFQRQIERETWENAVDVQLLAARTDARE